MKSVIISVVLLLATTAGVIVNIFYIDTTVSEIIEKAESMPIDSESFASQKDKAEEIYGLWGKQKNAVTYLVDYREVEEVDVACQKLYNSVRGEDFSAYLIARDEFIHALTRLRDISLITAENIL